MKYPHIESKNLEFKETLKEYSRLLETITAFSNMQGGTIIIGIRDSDREITGITREEINRFHTEIPQAVADAISPQIALDLYEQDNKGKTCLVIQVFPGPGKPYYIKKRGIPEGIIVRFGSHNRKADEYTIAELTRNRMGIRFETTPCPAISYSDLSPELLGKIFAQSNENLFIGSGFGTADVTGRIIPNVAATLLFYPRHDELIPESTISIAHYAGADKKNLIRSEILSGGIHTALESAFAYLTQLLGKDYELSGVRKLPTHSELPSAAVREALINAVVHRAYDYEAPIRVSVFSDRVEFLNPGSFYAPINLENIKEGLSRYRNPLIADALRKTGHIEKQGIGLSLIIDSCTEAGLKKPKFSELENHVKVTLFKTYDTGKPSLYESRFAGEAEVLEIFDSVENLSSSELAQRLGKSQAMAKKIIQKLKENKKIMQIGRGPATRWKKR